jgi:hypothetical protein
VIVSYLLSHSLGGAKGGVFYSKRYSASSGLNSGNLDFLPVQNIEDMDTIAGGLGSVPIGELKYKCLSRCTLFAIYLPRVFVC